MINNADILLLYLFKVSIVQAVLYAFYVHVLYRYTWFSYDRIYLLVILLISIILPLISYNPQLQNVLYSTEKKQLLDSLQISGGQAILGVKMQSNIQNIVNLLLHVLIAIYSIGVLFNIWKLGKQFFFINQLKCSALIQKSGKLHLCRTTEQKASFSFFNYVYLQSDFDELSSQHQEQIIEHEKLHAQQWHSADNLFVNIYHCFFWFNPLIINLKKSLQATHEFIVDYEMARKNNPGVYQKLLIKLALSESQHALISSFTNGSLLSRLQTMESREPEWLRKTRFIAAFPVFFLVMLFLWLLQTALLPPTHLGGNKWLMNSPLPAFTLIAAPFFEDSNIGNKMLASHKLLSFVNPSDSTIVRAPLNGRILQVDTIDNWGVSEISLSIRHTDELVSRITGLAHVAMAPGATIKTGSIVGYTGRPALYLTIGFAVFQNDKAVDPENYINLKK